MVSTELSHYFMENEVSAEDAFKGTCVRLTGEIDDIGTDIMGKPYVILKGYSRDYEYGPDIQCFFKDRQVLYSLRAGQRVTISGRIDTKFMNVLVKDCQL